MVGFDLRKVFWLHHISLSGICLPLCVTLKLKKISDACLATQGVRWVSGLVKAEVLQLIISSSSACLSVCPAPTVRVPGQWLPSLDHMHVCTWLCWGWGGIFCWSSGTEEGCFMISPVTHSACGHARGSHSLRGAG